MSTPTSVIETETTSDGQLEALRRLSRDLKTAAKTLSKQEVRYIVDAYYAMQENRKVADNQIRAMTESGEPHEVIAWLSDNSSILERNIKSVLDAHTSGNQIGRWAKSIVGIGPVIAAGLAAHIDMDRAPTVGHIWRFAGLDSTVKWADATTCAAWIKEQDIEDFDVLLDAAARWWGRDPASLRRLATTDFATKKEVPITRARLAKALARRPWNASLKTLCWKIGESFVKVSNHKDDFYGKFYKERKLLEERRNMAGDFSAQAQEKLERFNIGKGTDAYVWYAGCLSSDAAQKITNALPEKKLGLAKKLAGEPGSGVPMLPPAHIHARAKRYAVKLYLSHWHAVAYRIHFQAEPPKPYILTRELGDHVHEIVAPNWPMK